MKIYGNILGNWSIRITPPSKSPNEMKNFCQNLTKICQTIRIDGDILLSFDNPKEKDALEKYISERQYPLNELESIVEIGLSVHP